MTSGRSPLLRLAIAALAFVVLLPHAAGASEANRSTEGGRDDRYPAFGCPYKQRTLPPYAIRVQTQVRGQFGTFSWTETYPRLQLKERYDVCKNVNVFYSSQDSSHTDKKGFPNDRAGTLVASADFPASHGYPPGHCGWQTADHVLAGLDFGGDNSSGFFVVLAYPLFDPFAQLKKRCGGGVFGATASEARLDQWTLDPSASVKIGNGRFALCGAAGCPPFSTKLEIVYDPGEKVRPPHFPLSRIVAGKSFGLTFSFLTSDNPPETGSLRITFTRVR